MAKSKNLASFSKAEQGLLDKLAAVRAEQEAHIEQQAQKVADRLADEVRDAMKAAFLDDQELIETYKPAKGRERAGARALVKKLLGEATQPAEGK